MNGWELTTDWLQARAAASPHDVALIMGRRAWTFGGLDAVVNGLCGYLTRHGVTPGDHVGLLMPNSLAAVAGVFASARLGTVLVPLNGRLTAAELKWQIDRADCRHVLCLNSTESPAHSALGGRAAVHELPATVEELEIMLLASSEEPFQHNKPQDASAIQAIVFTSGTTGQPKGAMITYANHFWSAVGSAFKLGVQPDDRWLACLPLYHVGGQAILFRSCLYGTAVVLHDGFDVEAVLISLANESISLVSLVPTMLERLLRRGLSSKTAPALRLILLGGAAAPPALLADSAAVGLPVAVTYGLTEAASQVATLLPDEARRKPGSAGRPLLLSSIQIENQDGRPLSPGEVGEIVISGPTVMSGYYDESASTAAMLRGGRLHTGDVGYLDEDGDVWIVDRRDDLIVSGGENVYPAEVEQVLREHPGVAAACVVGLPHPEWGQQVAALVVAARRDAVTEIELLHFLRSRLAGYKQPRVLLFTDELPQTGSGKVRRRAVAEQLSARRELRS